MKKAVILEASAIDRGDVSWEPVLKEVDADIYQETTEEEKIGRIGDAEIVFNNKLIMDEAVFSACPNIRYLGICATGYNVVDLEAARRHGITVTNVPAYSTESVAQHAWALIMEITSRTAEHDRLVKDGEWTRSGSFSTWITPVKQLSGRTIGVYGFGNIGRRMTEIARAFGMNVLVHTAHPEKYRSFADDHVTFTDEETLFKASDIITFHCPLTPETKEIVRAENIAKMRDGVILINVSRGPLINEADLKAALVSGKVAAAAVDVVSVEPILPDNPLLTAPHMIITPHMAWSSVDAREVLIRIVAENLRAWLDGRPVHVVS